MTSSLKNLLEFINPPLKIEGIQHIHQLIHSKDRLTLIELEFFHKLPKLVQMIQEVEGDILIAGVWRGGAAMYIYSLCKHLNQKRRIWLADTFDGFIPENTHHLKDKKAINIFNPIIKSDFPSPEIVAGNFNAMGLWDENVKFIKGPLEETLQFLPFDQLALMHIDVDLYEPTFACLELAYQSVSPNGIVIIDDYGAPIFECKAAVDRFRSENKVDSPIIPLNDYIIYWVA